MALLSQSTEHTVDRAAGALLGLALGDAMGRPGRGWPQLLIRRSFGWISDLATQPVAGRRVHRPAGAMGSATRAAFRLATSWPDPALRHPRARELCPEHSSLTAHILMPIGIACRSGADIATQIVRLAPTQAAHSTLAGAALVSGLVSSAIEAPPEAGDPIFLAAHLELGFRTVELLDGCGRPDVADSMIERCLLAREIAVRAGDDADFLTILHDRVGLSATSVDSVPAAVGLLVRADANPTRTSVLAANLGGESSRIGALATAMAGAVCGRASVAPQWCAQLEQVNSVCSVSIAEQLLSRRA